MKLSGPVVITGFMGCGKSGVARELARRLQVSMVDLDEKITQREGRTPAQLIVDNGEPAFRAIESDVLGELLKERPISVIALGGGAWIDEANRALIQQYGCRSVWLDAPFELCWSRITASGDDRPLGKTRAQAQTLYDARRTTYQLASIHVKVLAGESLAVLAARIQTKLATGLQD